jgi:hypothetical protein
LDQTSCRPPCRTRSHPRERNFFSRSRRFMIRYYTNTCICQVGMKEVPESAERVTEGPRRQADTCCLGNPKECDFSCSHCYELQAGF